MKVLFCSHLFPPSVGGLETVSKILADQFSSMGIDVVVVTSTPGEDSGGQYKVFRNPAAAELMQLAKNADIIFQNNISLRTLLPLLWIGKPIVIAHHTWISRAGGKRGWQDLLKRALLPRCCNIAISHAIAADLPVESIVVGNPFEAAEFATHRNDMRTKDVVFVGRLVSDKGCDTLLRAVAILADRDRRVSLTVLGDGPERVALEALGRALGIDQQVEFRGAVRQGRGAVVAQHVVMAIPSRWAEPFGIVALEGLAAGCAVVATHVGGLPEAVGSCGMLVERENPEALADALDEMLASEEIRQGFKSKTIAHLEQFEPSLIASRYIEVFQTASKN